VIALAFLPTYADEGMWLLTDLDNLPFDSLHSAGLRLSPADIFSPEKGGLARAVITFGGGTGSFVSSDGLILTNHHVAYTAIQRQSKPEHNYLENGFYAATKEQELQAIGYNLYALQSIEDVTDKVLSALNEKMTDLQRYLTIEKISKEIIAAAEKAPDLESDFVSMYGGSQYYLHTYFKIKDLRLVFAPPRSIGDFGGEIDNWIWPRHAGDFAFLRAYVAPDGKPAEYSPENVPFRPEKYLKVSTAGLKEGDLVFLLGYPGRTRRNDCSFSIEKTLKHDYPLDLQTRLELIALLEKESEADKNVAIKLSSRLKGLYNYLKKNQGIVEGFAKSGLLEKKVEQENQLQSFFNPDRTAAQECAAVLTELDSLYEQNIKLQQKDFLLGWMTNYCDFLRFAATIYKWDFEKEKPDLQREPGYQNRDTSETVQWLQAAQVNLVPKSDQKVLLFFLEKALMLPPGQKIQAVEDIIKGQSPKAGKQALKNFVAGLYKGTKLGAVEQRLKMFRMNLVQLEASNDPFINFARKLEKDREQVRTRNKEFRGALTRLEPDLMQLYARWKNGRLYPDANSTIRFNYGKVRDFKPRDAVTYACFTTLSGVIEKNTGKEPFDAPEELQKAYAKQDWGAYWDKSLEGVPVDFLTDLDITNGNSGSPVLDGRGRLVGLAFDGNYEGMTSDFQYNPRTSRTICVDIRYILFLVDKVYQAGALIEELSPK
jgi:hypothetical protein